MNSTKPADTQSCPGFDQGLLSPVTVTSDPVSGLSDSEFFEALIETEIALTRAWGAIGIAPLAAVAEIREVFGASENFGSKLFETVLRESASGGNPVIALVQEMRGRLSPTAAVWLHAGATSQDIFDSAFMLLLKRSGENLVKVIDSVLENLKSFAEQHRDTVCAGRTLTQHAVPTTIGLRAALWAAGISRAHQNLQRVLTELPVQLSGAGGTQAAFVEIGGAPSAELVEQFANELRLSNIGYPWHVVRWPVTDLGDALTSVIDAIGVLAGDVLNGVRTEVGEYVLSSGGGSSAMPHKNNPTAAVLIKSAALQAPHLAATLHQATALAVDERPDGAWHAQWQPLRELGRLAHGSAASASILSAGLQIDTDRVAQNLNLTGSMIVSERISLFLAPHIGAARVKELVGGGAEGLALRLAKEPGVTEALDAAGLSLSELLNPTKYLGRCGELVDEILNNL